MDVEVHKWFQPECYDCGWVGDVHEGRHQADKEASEHDCADNQNAWTIRRNENGTGGFVGVLSSGYGEDRYFVLSEVDVA